MIGARRMKLKYARITLSLFLLSKLSQTRRFFIHCNRIVKIDTKGLRPGNDSRLDSILQAPAR